jgi:hypothetical protein
VSDTREKLKISCKHCLWFHQSNPDAAVGECRRYAPRALTAIIERPSDYGDAYGMFPLMSISEWCGEFGSKGNEAYGL